jgi:2,3-bisphosphoglycerate-independent phosphoglycerate mutase
MSSPPDSHAPTVLVIRDGWGANPHPEHDAFNAIKLADTPVADQLESQWPHVLIHTSGEDVGLPDGIMGNSEVGHQNIGAGRIVDQEVMRITQSVREGSFFENPALHRAFDRARASGGCVHLLGLVSDGLVHSDVNHLLALIDMAARVGFPGDRVLVHAITDGRDTSPMSGLGYVRRVEESLAGGSRGRIASVIGRFWAMDRDNRWERVARAWACLTGQGSAAAAADIEPAATAEEAVQRYYDNPSDTSRVGDEFITPTPVGKHSPVRSGDTVIFFNFRGDRPRELTKAFMFDDDAWAQVPRGGFDRGARPTDLFFCTMTGYESGLPVTAVAFEKPPSLVHILGETVSKAGLTQFRCAETEKFPHVTFFFNDYHEEPFEGEHRLLVPSPTDVMTYDQKPEMSAHDVCEGVLERIEADDCEPVIIVNFANTDMVGHTGKLPAVVTAAQTVDACVGRIVEAVLRRGGGLVVTADHGNAEQMWDPVHDCPHTAHTTYDVPLFVVDERYKGQKLRTGGRLADIAPTLLKMAGLEQPAEMTGQSLLEA